MCVVAALLIYAIWSSIETDEESVGAFVGTLMIIAFVAWRLIT
jgi:hypothetical protein